MDGVAHDTKMNTPMKRAKKSEYNVLGAILMMPRVSADVGSGETGFDERTDGADSAVYEDLYNFRKLPTSSYSAA